MPAGPVQSRRPPREVVVDLTRQIASAPSRTDLVSLRAHEAELNLDFTTSEQDWKTFARLSADKAAGSVALADYYHRRLATEGRTGRLARSGSATRGGA